MIEKKKTDIIDDFISKVQSHPSAMKKAQRIDDLEAVYVPCLPLMMSKQSRRQTKSATCSNGNM